MSDKKQLVLDIKQWLEEMEEILVKDSHDKRARNLLEECYIELS